MKKRFSEEQIISILREAEISTHELYRKHSIFNATFYTWRKKCGGMDVLVHSDQGSQYTSHEWQSFLKSHGLEGNMSHRGKYHDNAVAESFFPVAEA